MNQCLQSPEAVNKRAQQDENTHHAQDDADRKRAQAQLEPGSSIIPSSDLLSGRLAQAPADTSLRQQEHAVVNKLNQPQQECNNRRQVGKRRQWVEGAAKRGSRRSRRSCSGRSGRSCSNSGSGSIGNGRNGSSDGGPCVSHGSSIC